jgi:hypothetical protein
MWGNSCVHTLFLVPGLFRSWYGWSAEAKTHWIMPIIGTGIFGFGAMMTLYALLRHFRCGYRLVLFCLFSLPIHLYLVDTFTYAASALSAASVRLSLAILHPMIICAERGIGCRM